MIAVLRFTLQLSHIKGKGKAVSVYDPPLFLGLPHGYIDRVW